MIKKKIKYKKTIILFVTIICLFLFLKYRRVHVKWDEELHLLNGDKIKVSFDWSHRAYYEIIPHSAIGGGGDRIDFALDFMGKTFRYGSKYIPVLIQKWEGEIYIFLYDIFSWKNSLKILNIDNKINEIPISDFPRNIAIQNRFSESFTGVGLFPEKSSKECKIDPNDNHFRQSFTARIWYLLETGKNLLDNKIEIDKDFLIKYINKYIEPVARKNEN